MIVGKTTCKVKELSRNHGFNDTSIYNLKSELGGMVIFDFRLIVIKELDAENPRLKKLVTVQTLDNQTIEEIISKKCSLWLLLNSFAVHSKKAMQ